MKRLLFLAPLALAGCATLFGPRAPFAEDRKGDLVEYNYAWSAEASAVPQLVRRLQSDLETLFSAATARAQSDRAAARLANRPFNGHRFNRRWTTAGQSSRLLSLQGETVILAGSTDASRGIAGLLWDRLARREVKAVQLFAGNGLATRLHAPYCASLQRSPGSAPACPSLETFVVIPTDSDGDRRFDRFRLAMTQSAFGASGDGRHEQLVPVTSDMRAALRAPYRSSFAVQPQ